MSISARGSGGSKASAAEKISYDNSESKLNANNVQDALDELEEKKADSKHGTQHEVGGDDPITPDGIGAAPKYTYGTEDLTEGVSELATGTLYFVYE